jgi:Polyketide cyclase / dehydrase and lipid transport
MPANGYQFVTHWWLSGTPEQVSDLLNDTDTLIRIWPSLYKRATVVEPGGENGIGRVLSVETRGHLPYTLRWSFRLTESRHPYGYSIEAWGDMVGRGVWTFERDNDTTRVTYDWRVRTEKPLLKLLSPILKALFRANHDRVMADGEVALRAEQERRRAATRNAPA